MSKNTYKIGQLTRLSEPWPSLQRLAGNCELLDDITRILPASDFTKIGQEIWRMQLEMYYALSKLLLFLRNSCLIDSFL